MEKGHGTPVASAAGGKGYGIAKAANLPNVKFFNGDKPSYSRLVSALQAITRRHNSRKIKDSFKGSVINMSFKVRKTNELEVALNDAAAAGISLVASAGNDNYDPGENRYPSKNTNVIPVGASTRDYTPWTDSNYGDSQVTLWAPAYSVPLITKSGKFKSNSGTSFSSGYVAGVLANFYAVEGKNMNPDLALKRLKDQTSNWITLPDRGGQDWHNSPTALANTGNRKGAAKDPPVKYIGGPEVDAAASPSPSPTKNTATPTPTPTDTCSDKYQVFDNHFEIYGKNFDPTKLGPNDSGLKKQIEGCSTHSVTSWGFHTLTNDPQGFQWFAKGDTIINQKRCVGAALTHTGGVRGSCSGSGL